MEMTLDIHSRQLNLLLAPREITRQLSAVCTVRLALAGPVLVLDGGNCFDARKIATLLRRQTSRLETILERIYVARAFTCYQMVALLAETHLDHKPTLILELLATFQDENVALPERQRLLQQSLLLLRHLSSQAAVLVTVCTLSSQYSGSLMETLTASADQIWRFEAAAAPVLQPGLWSKDST